MDGYLIAQKPLTEQQEAHAAPQLLTESTVRARTRQLVARHGAREAARLLGLHVQTALALAAKAPVRAGTIAQAREGLARIAAERLDDQ